jgi:copper chaperone CopZ
MKLVFTSLLFGCLLLLHSSVNAQNGSQAVTYKTIELKVDGMTCQQGCADGIDRKFKTVKGVKKSTTTLKSGTSKITYDPGTIDVKTLISIIEDRGYTAKIARG